MLSINKHAQESISYSSLLFGASCKDESGSTWKGRKARLRAKPDSPGLQHLGLEDPKDMCVGPELAWIFFFKSHIQLIFLFFCLLFSLL